MSWLNNYILCNHISVREINISFEKHNLIIKISKSKMLFQYLIKHFDLKCRFMRVTFKFLFYKLEFILSCFYVIKAILIISLFTEYSNGSNLHPLAV